MKNSTYRMWVCVSAAVLTAPVAALGSTISLEASQYAVLTGGTLNTDQNVMIGGFVGSAGNVYLGNNTSVAMGVYTNGSFGTGTGVLVGGNVISGSGGASLGNGTAVGLLDTRGYVSIDNNSVLGGVRTTQGAWIGNGTHVAGDFSSGAYVSIGSKVTIDGQLGHGSGYWAPKNTSIGSVAKLSTVEPDTWTATSIVRPTLSSSSWTSMWKSNNSTTALAPGDYGAMSISNNSTVTLTAGTYNIQSAWLGANTKFLADTSGGDVIINIVGGLSTEANVAFTGVGDGDLRILAGGNIYLGQCNVTNADIYGFGTVNIDQKTTIDGRLYSAGNLWMGSGVSVTGAGSSPVPEPMTAAMLGVGAWMMWRRRGIAA